MNTRNTRKTRTWMVAAWVLGFGLNVTVAAPETLGAWIEALEGVWYADTGRTPLGAMGFALAFEPDEDGSVHSRSVHDRETWVDLRFRKGEDGRWRLDQSASMAGLGEQGSTLVPADAPGVVRRWVLPDDRSFLSVEFERDDDRLALRVWLRGEEHVAFDLRRATPEEAEAIRAEFARNADREPDGFGDLMEDPVAAARAAVEADPDDARAHLRHAVALREAIVADARRAPGYAGAMLEALSTALGLDPGLTPAYHELVGYYLHAPAFAGGSLDRAEETARRLETIDPEQGAELLAVVRRERERRSAQR